VPEIALVARRWITPFRVSFPDVHMENVELIAEGDKVVGRFTCSLTHLGQWLGHAPTGRRFERVDPASSGDDDHREEVRLRDHRGKLRLPASILIALVIALAVILLLTVALRFAPR
jgi:hypothetical protein